MNSARAYLLVHSIIATVKEYIEYEREHMPRYDVDYDNMISSLMDDIGNLHKTNDYLSMYAYYSDFLKSCIEEIGTNNDKD